MLRKPVFLPVPADGGQWLRYVVRHDELLLGVRGPITFRSLVGLCFGRLLRYSTCDAYCDSGVICTAIVERPMPHRVAVLRQSMDGVAGVVNLMSTPAVRRTVWRTLHRLRLPKVAGSCACEPAASWKWTPTEADHIERIDAEGPVIDEGTVISEGSVMEGGEVIIEQPSDFTSEKVKDGTPPEPTAMPKPAEPPGSLRRNRPTKSGTPHRVSRRNAGTAGSGQRRQSTICSKPPAPQEPAQPDENGTDELDDLFGSLNVRSWTDDTGRYRTSGRLAAIGADAVRILKTNGRYLHGPL